MANIRAAAKSARKDAKRHAQRVQVKSELSTVRKKFLNTLTDQAARPEAVSASLQHAIKRFSQAAANGFIHRNTASRKIGRLMRRMAKNKTPKA